MKGFTLVELLIVVVLLALAATLAFPVLADSDATRVQAAARLLAADLGYAQMESITHADDPTLLIVNPGVASYFLARSSAPGSPIQDPVTGQAYEVRFGTGRAAELAGVTNVGYDLGGDDRIQFGRYGELDQTTPAEIQLQCGAVSLIVRVDPTSGEVSITNP